MHFLFFGVDQDLGAFRASITIVVGCEWQIVAGEEILNKFPRQVRLCKRNVTSVFQSRCCNFFKLFIGFWCFNARFFQSVFIVIHDWRGRVEWHADHFAVIVSIEIANTGDIIFDVEGDAIVSKQILHGNGCAFGTDDGCRPSIEDLHDVWLFASTEGGDTSGQGVFVATLEDRGDFVIALGRIEFFSNRVDSFTQLATHCVPPGDFGLSVGNTSHQAQRGAGCCDFQEVHCLLQTNVPCGMHKSDRHAHPCRVSKTIRVTTRPVVRQPQILDRTGTIPSILRSALALPHRDLNRQSSPASPARHPCHGT